MRDRIVPRMTLPLGQIRAGKGSRPIILEPNSFDRESRTLRYVLTTDTPCPAMRFRDLPDGDFEAIWVQEILEPANCINLDKVRGLPLVNCHDYSDLEKVLGKHLSAEIKGNGIECVALVSRSARVQAMYDDFEDGIFNAASVGYDIVEDGELEVDPNGGPPIVRPKRWAINEGSFVVIPADQNAGLRQKRDAKRNAPKTQETDMTPEQLTELMTLVRSTNEGLTEIRSKVEVLEAARGKGDGKDGKSGKGNGDNADPEGQRDDDMDDMSDDERAKRSKALETLRPMAQRCGYAAFDDMAALGTPIPELKAELRKRMTTSGVQIDANSRGGDHAQRGTVPSGGSARSIADLKIEDSFFFKRHAEQAKTFTR